MGTKGSVCVVEDDGAMLTMLRYNLKKAGYVVTGIENGLEASHYLAATPPDLLLLDWMLPDKTGSVICREVRERDSAERRTPIIMITARGREDCPRALGMGVDDYMVKPVSVGEVLTRVGGLMSRERMRQKGNPDCLVCGTISLDPQKHRVSVLGRLIDLGPKEYSILRFLMKNQNMLFSRGAIKRVVWPDEEINDQTIDVHIGRLRAKLFGVGNKGNIHTVYDQGYKLEK